MKAKLNVFRNFFKNITSCRSQTWLGSCIAVAMAQAGSCSSDLTPAPEFPYAAGTALNKKKKKITHQIGPERNNCKRLGLRNCQSNREEQKSSRRHDSHRPQAILQSHSNQDSVVLALKQTYRPMEQNREPRNKPRHLQSINKGGKNIKWGKDSFFSKWYWENQMDACKSMTLEHRPSHHAQK